MREDLQLQQTSNGYDYEAIGDIDEKKSNRSKYFIPDSMHPHTEAIAFENLRVASIKRNVTSTYTALKASMEASNFAGSQHAAEEIPFDTLIESKTAIAAELGYYWNPKKKGLIWTDLEWQAIFTKIGKIITTGAQWSEAGFVAAGITISIFSADNLNSPLFIFPFAITTLCSPGALEMNWNFTIPDEDVPDIVCPAQVRFHIPTYEQENKIIFNYKEVQDQATGRTKIVEGDIYDRSKMEYQNEADVAFHRVMLRYAQYEPNNFYDKLNYTTSWFVLYSTLCNHGFGPFGNWTAIGYATSAAKNIPIKLALGIATFLPIEVTGASYYAVTNEPLLKQVRESYISSRNPVARAYRIANPAAFFMGLLEWLSSGFSRAAGIVITANIGYEYLGLKDILSEDEFEQLATQTTYWVGLGILIFSLVVRGARSFGPITNPLTFATPFGDSQTITNVKILEIFGAHSYVKSQFSAKDRNYLLKKAVLLSACWTLPMFFTLALLLGDKKEAAIHLAWTFFTILITYYRGDKENLMRDRAGKVISIIRGRSPFLSLTGEEIRFAYGVTGCDAVPRTLSKSGGIVAIPIIKTLFLEILRMDPLMLFLLTTLWVIPSAKVDVLYYLGAMLKNAPRFIKDIQYASRRRINDGTSEGKEKTRWYTAYPTQALAILFVKIIAPCVFRENSREKAPEFNPIAPATASTAAKAINLRQIEKELKEEKGNQIGCCTRIKKKLYTLFGWERPQPAQENQAAMPAVKEAYSQVMRDEKHFSDSVKLTSWLPCYRR